MTSIFLIADTPNAGPLGHRYLVAEGATIGDAKVSSFVSKGRTKSQTVGDDYIAVRHNIIQRNTGRPDACETLVLVGVDTSKLTNEGQTEIVRRLQSLLSNLDKVVQDIDWSKEQRLIVPHKTLANWGAENFSSLPSVKDPKDLRFLQSSKRTTALPSVVTLIFILVFAGAIGLLGSKLPYLSGNAIVGNDAKDHRQKTEPKKGATAAFSNSKLAAILEEIQQDVRSKANLPNCKSRLDEIEREKLTKDEQRTVDDLREKIKSHEQEMQVKQADSIKANDDYLQKTENELRKKNSNKDLKSLLSGIYNLPHPDHATKDQKDRRNLLQTKIETEISWNKFEENFQQIMRPNTDLPRAASRLLTWTKDKGKKDEWMQLREVFTKRWKESLEKQIGGNASFEPARKLVKSSDIEKVVDSRVFKTMKDKLDLAEDRYLYEKIRTSSSHTDQLARVNDYLHRKVGKKRMEIVVKEYKQFLTTSNNEMKVTLAVKSIYWGEQTLVWGRWSEKDNRITVEFYKKDQKEKSKGKIFKGVSSEKSGEHTLSNTPITVSIIARRNDEINLKLCIKASESHHNGTFNYTGTVANLYKISGLWQDNLEYESSNSGRKASGNKIMFEVQVNPIGPKLPPYTKDDPNPGSPGSPQVKRRPDKNPAHLEKY